MKAFEVIEDFNYNMAKGGREGRLKAYLREEKIEHHFLGGYTGASCARMRKEEVRPGGGREGGKKDRL